MNSLLVVGWRVVRHPLAHFRLEFVGRHAGMRGRDHRNKPMVSARKHSLEVGRQHRFEGLLVLPFRVLRCQGLDPIEGKGDLKRIGPFRPQRAVIVERGNALFWCDKILAARLRDPRYEIQDGFLRRAIVPRGQGVIGPDAVAL